MFRLSTLTVLACCFMFGQPTRVDLKNQASNIDLTGAVSTKPMKVGTLLPAACSAGEAFAILTGPPGSNVFICTATNTWTAQGSTGQASNAGAIICNDTGAPNALTCTAPNLANYAAGLVVYVLPANTNTGPATINVNSLGSQPITKSAAIALTGGELQMGVVVPLVYDGTSFRTASLQTWVDDGTTLNSLPGRRVYIGPTVTGGIRRSLQQKLGETVSVTDFGADPAGIQDSVPGIQAAINYVGSLGGGTVLFPPGTYRLASYSTNSPATWNLAIGYDNITLQGMGGPESVVMYQAASGSTIISAQCTHAINIGVTPDIFTNTYQDPRLNGGFYTANSVAQEDTTITFVNAGDSAAFAAGDIIAAYGNAGVLSSVNHDIVYPEEVNQIVSVSSGVLTLKWPMARILRDGTTTRSYIAKVTSLTRKNITLANLTIRAGQGPNALQVLGLTIENCILQADTTLNPSIAAITIGNNTIRGWRMSNNRFEPYGTGTNLWSFELPSKASMDGIFENNEVNYTFLSAHEYSAHLVISNNRFNLGTVNGAKGDGTPGTPSYGAIIGGRDVKIEGNTWHTKASTGYGLSIGAIGGFDAGQMTVTANQMYCQGHCLENSLSDTPITGNTIASTGGLPINCDGDNVRCVITGNRIYTNSNGAWGIGICANTGTAEAAVISGNTLISAIGTTGTTAFLANCANNPSYSHIAVTGNSISGYANRTYTIGGGVHNISTSNNVDTSGVF